MKYRSFFVNSFTFVRAVRESYNAKLGKFYEFQDPKKKRRLERGSKNCVHWNSAPGL
jgi:hypothetical protein